MVTVRELYPDGDGVSRDEDTVTQKALDRAEGIVLGFRGSRSTIRMRWDIALVLDEYERKVRRLNLELSECYGRIPK